VGGGIELWNREESANCFIAVFDDEAAMHAGIRMRMPYGPRARARCRPANDRQAPGVPLLPPWPAAIETASEEEGDPDARGACAGQGKRSGGLLRRSPRALPVRKPAHVVAAVVRERARPDHCYVCGGVCTAEEGDCAHCGTPVGSAPVTQPDDRLRRHWCSSECRDAALEQERQDLGELSSEGSGPAGQFTAEWKDDPEVRDAMARAAEVLAILALPDEEEARAGLAACGLYPVALVHGELDSDEAVELITGWMARAAGRLGCRHKSGGNDATTYLFPSHDAAVDFLAEVTGFAKSWWTVTVTARPVCNRGGAW
jgi:hypothetical protein